MLHTLVDPVVAEIEVPAPKSIPLVELGPVVNRSTWSDFYASCANTKTRKDKQRVDNATAEQFQRTRLEDGDVLRLHQALARRCPKTKTRDGILVALKDAIASLHTVKIRGIPTEVAEPDTLKNLMSIKGPDLLREDLTEKDFWDYQLVKLLAKYPFAGMDDEAELQAIKSFWECESLNKATNARAREWDKNHELANEVRERIAVMLGAPPNIGEIVEAGTWGPGTNAGYDFKSSETGAEMKFLSRVSVTPSAYPLATAVLPQYTEWCRFLLDTYGHEEWSCLVPGAELTTVAKKFLMRRTITMEPLFNAWIQAAIGRVIRKRLKRLGWDLSNSWQVNQRRAREGSVTGIFGTEDLKDASNRVCYEVVRAVLPSCWFAFLDQVRSPTVLLPEIVDGKLGALKRHTLEMFSSMGNGATFELESVIFMALAQVVVPAVYKRHPRNPDVFVKSWEDAVSVFGDDVVLPGVYAHKYREACREFGMQTNLDKSFSSGPFRESCGQDWYRGTNIRPLQLTDRVQDGFELQTLCNVIRSFAHRHEDSPSYTGYASERWAGMWALAHSHLPIALRKLNSTPPSVDGGIWNQFSEVPHVDTEKGQPSRWRLVVRQSASVKLSSEVFTYRGRRKSWVFTGNGDNLLAARLADTTVVVSHKHGANSPADSEKPYVKMVEQVTGISGAQVGKADVTTLRYNFVYRLGYGRLVRPSMWLGWKRLRSDFGL